MRMLSLRCALLALLLVPSLAFGEVVVSSPPTVPGGTTGQLQYNNSNRFGGTAPTYNGLTITGIPTPIGSLDASSKGYVDAAVAALNPAVNVQAATTVAGDTSAWTYSNGASGIGATITGPNNTAITIDGYTFTVLDTVTTPSRLLIKDDTVSPSGARNGVYRLTVLQTAITGAIFTRALDYDQPSDINASGDIPVVNGSINRITSWRLTSSVTTIGTDALLYQVASTNPSNNAVKNATQVFSGQQSASITTLAISSTTFTPDGSNNDYKIVLTSACASAACTLANPSATPVAGTHGIIYFVQPASGGPASFGTYGSSYVISGGTSGITLSTSANQIDAVGYTVMDSTHVVFWPGNLNVTH